VILSSEYAGQLYTAKQALSRPLRRRAFPTPCCEKLKFSASYRSVRECCVLRSKCSRVLLTKQRLIDLAAELMIGQETLAEMVGTTRSRVSFFFEQI